MSSFLSAADNVAGKCQNIRRGLKKMKEESRVAELALENHKVFFCFFCAVQEKYFNYTKTIIFIFWYHCDVVDDALGMTSSAVR